MRGTVFVPETYTDASTSCKVIAKGDQVTDLIKTGDVVMCQVGLGTRNSGMFPGTRDFLCQENNIYAVIRNGKLYPFGKRILIRRDIQDEYHGTIVIPENRRSQSLTGTIERVGISREPFKVNGITVGAKIRLTEWNESMTEIELEDGQYGLIVNDSDILCIFED
jgi:co-chaperonin GroES (HSP10)